jgi:hypothetical protein
VSRTLWFVVPAHGRTALTRICLRQLRRTCDELEQFDVEASAVVIADDENLETARELGFGTVRRDNRWLSRKFNDGIQLATDPRYNRRPAQYVVPCGSDDWVSARVLAGALPEYPNLVVGFQLCAFVREDGRELSASRVSYRGGVGIRIYPAALFRRCGFRPADEDRPRGCDTSILVNVTRANERKYHGVVVEHRDSHALQIVDFKSPGEQLNPYGHLETYAYERFADPWELLASEYPDESVFEMREHYAQHASPALV